MMIALLASLTGCITKTEIIGDFCLRYVQVDMAGSEAAKLERRYQERILINELSYEQCKQ